ncbi:MAG: acyl-[ACP]--phospholipid O-acyltransferase [Planctomycetota bacterium]
MSEGERLRQGSLRPLMVTQFLGAFNDNAWKLMVIVMLSRSLGSASDDPEQAAQTRAMLAFAVFTLPLMLFSLPAGVLADRLSKRTVILAMKGLECLLMAAAALLLLLAPASSVSALVLLGAMGLQSAVFGPAKYGILPELVPHGRLSAANGQLELWTFLAIIAGTVAGPLLLEGLPVPALAGCLLAILSLVGLAAALWIPRVPAARKEGGLVETTLGAYRVLRGSRALWLSVLGLSWFWGIASLLGQDMLVYTHLNLGLGEGWTGVPLGLFGLGVGVGAFLAGRVSGGNVETGLIPLGALGLGLSTLALGLLGPGILGTSLLCALAGAASGFLLVPMNALLQWRAPPERRASVIALANVFMFAGMLAGSLSGWLMAEASLSARGILLGSALLTLAGTVWSLWILPEAFLRFVCFLFTHTVYRLRVLGRQNVPAEGGVLLTPNHMSLADGLFLMATIDRPIRFVIDEEQFSRTALRPFFKILGAIPISAGGLPRQILRALRDAGRSLEQGEVVCIFPEGQITRTGAMLPFRRGMEKIVRGTPAPIVPVHLDQVWGSIFSFSGGRFLSKLPERIPYPVTVSFGRPLPAETPMSDVREAVVTLGEEAWRERKRQREPLHRSFIRTARRRPWRLAVAEKDGPRLSRLGALAGAVALARKLAPCWEGQQNVGILLPPTVGGALATIAASLSGRTSVPLNYTAGTAGLSSAIRQAGLKTVLTSQAFLEKVSARLEGDVLPIWIEEQIGSLTRREKIRALLAALFLPAARLERSARAHATPAMDDVATIIFSSGSTGEPKGVMLTHFNLDSNVEAVSQVFRPTASDRLLGILPLFHSFGFMSLWFALNSGIAVVFQPNPLDGAAVGGLVRDFRVTMLLGTPTFLSLYLRRCTAEQFGSLRLVLAGAEKLPDRLADQFEERFGIRPLEGYGATECSPVIATCVPAYRAPGFFQAGSKRSFVGPPLPGVSVKIVDPDSGEVLPVNTSGLLLVRGPNVMKGYLDRDDLTREVLRDGWYDTGDIALIDEEGFLKITDRASRFSKIGGEMVPHGRVEEALESALGGSGSRHFALTGLADEKKGERLAVLTTVPQDRLPELLSAVSASGLPNLFVPRLDAFVTVAEIPVLGSGKLDLAEVRRIAARELG